MKSSDGVEERVGRRLRALRLAQKFSLESAASRAGVSKSLLSKIENGRVSSPISTYSRIAVVLGATLGDVLFEGEGNGLVVVRRDERKAMPAAPQGAAYRSEALGYKKRDKRMEPFLLTYPPGVASRAELHHDAEEFIFVLSGRLEFTHGGSVVVLEAGDALYCDGRVPHGGRALGRKAAVAIVVAAPA